MISSRFLTRLRSDLAQRRIENGIRLLRSQRAVLRTLRPVQQNAALFLSDLAQWVDVGYDRPALVKTVVARFSDADRLRLSVREYLGLSMAEGFVAMSEGRYEDAIKTFNLVLGFDHETRDKELIRVSQYWTARCRRNQARYEDALEHLREAIRDALASRYVQMAAVMKVLEGGLVFQKGQVAGAKAILAEASAVLANTDDYVSLGNLHSAYGRIGIREGNYNQALESFARSIQEYRKRDIKHRNIARSLLGIATAKRLLALQILKAPGSSDGGRALPRPKPNGGRIYSATRPTSTCNRLHREAMQSLKQAESIYRSHENLSGLTNVCVARGYIYLDSGKLRPAACEAAHAFDLADKRGDSGLKSRARILQSAVAYAQSVGDSRDGADSGLSAQSAIEHGRDSVELAKATQDSHLLAEAYIALGFALSLNLPDNEEAAQECVARASELLSTGGNDNVWQDLQSLKRQLHNTMSIDKRLREWSEGVLQGSQTFQEITEEFASIVIPRVWERENRTISRVVERLSISPKRVRKILRAQGLLQRGSHD
jgi:tetratricopeptide (TPR) repeat protein